MKNLKSMMMVVCVVVGLNAGASDQIPGARQSGPIAIVGVTIHPVKGKLVREGIVVFEGGKISAVGAEVKIPDGATVVDGEGKHVYPGLIASWTSLGLVEVSRVRETVDSREMGVVNSNVKAQVAINPDSEAIPVARADGVLMALSVPTGGTVSGSSTLIKLDGWTFEDMTLVAKAGMHVNWPRMVVGGSGAKGRDGVLKSLEDLFDNAEAYEKGLVDGVAGSGHDDKLAAMVDVLRGETPLVVVADRLRQIESAVAFAKRHGVRLVIYGGADAGMCTDLLIANDVAVIVSGTLRAPRLRHDAHDAAFTLPARLHEAGVTFCLAGVKSSGAGVGYADVRELVNHAARAVAYGLPRHIGLKAITQYPAEIFGVGDQVGAIQKGMDATLILTDGDVLQSTSHVEKAWIDGKAVDLTSRHTQLFKKYRQKYRQLKTSE